MKTLIAGAAIFAASLASAAPSRYSVSLLEIPPQNNYGDVAEEQAAAHFGDYLPPWDSLPAPQRFVWPEVYDVHAIDRNNAGDTVGSARISPNPEAATDYRSWYAQAGGVAQDMGTLGSTRTIVSDMNNAGQAVGYSDIVLFDPHAFVWDQGAMYDLNTLAGQSDWLLTRAVAINDDGAIIGLGQYLGKWAAFMATPVTQEPVARIAGGAPLAPIPEPETYVLMLAGLGLLVLRRRR